MNLNHCLGRRLALTAIFSLGSLLAFQDAPATQPDNTKVNKMARDGSQPTADSAHNNKSDVQIMAEIRRAVVKDKTLHTYGHNVKIIADHGKVTLKGPVHSEEAKKNIEAKAVAVAGDGNVTNEITVKGDSH